MKNLFCILIFTFQSCTYYALNPPKSKNSSLLDNQLLLFALIYTINNSSCGGNGKFWIRDLTSSTGSTYCVDSNLVGSANGAEFYLDKNLNSSILDFSSIVSEYNNKIYPALNNAFGSPSDINKDGKVIILTTDIKDGSTANSGFVAGFVDPLNFSKDVQGSVARSNAMEILYMDGAELITKRTSALKNGDPDPYLATVAHEMQHLIRFQYSKGGDATWIDEGTSEVSSDLSGYGPQSDRIKCFRGDTSYSICSSNPIGIQGTSPFNWGSTLRNYAYSYAFMRYIYLASGSNSTQRNTFLQSSVVGINNFRASTSDGLMEVFKTSSAYINNNGSTALGSNSSSMFTKLFIYFFGRSQDFTSFSNTDVFIAGSGTDLTSVNTNFPLNYSTYTLPSGITNLRFLNSTSTAVPTTLSPGTVYLRSGSVSSGSLPSTTASYMNSSNGATGYLVMNPSGSGSNLSGSILSSGEEIELHEGINCITPNLFIREVRTRSHDHRYLFDKP